jgi:hypothetical protein
MSLLLVQSFVLLIHEEVGHGIASNAWLHLSNRECSIHNKLPLEDLTVDDNHQSITEIPTNGVQVFHLDL